MIGFFLVLLLISIISACGGNEKEGNLRVMMGPYYFSPSELTVKAGSEVTLVLQNTETFQGEPHDWVLMEAGYKAEAPFTEEDQKHSLTQMMVHPNQTETLTFTAPGEPGDYQVVCGIPDHLEFGMQGKLVVIP